MMRAWLVERGLLKSKEQKKKEEMLRMMHDAWGRVADPVWDAWNDSYMHNWLVGRGIIKSDFEKKRDDLTNLMNSYYYGVKDTAWSNWTDSELRQWLIDHGVMKSDAQASRDKMIKMVEDNYLHARDTFWHAWTDNALRNWLTENGYLRTDAQVKRDQLVSLADEKWKEERARMQSYLTWPDARLRAYLREQGVEEKYLPGDRPGLLQETRIRWVMTQNRAETLFQKIKELVNSGMYKAEDALLRLVHMLGAGWEEAKEKTSETFDEVRSRGSHEYHEAKRHGEEGWTEAKHQAGDDAGWVKREGEAKTAKLKGEL
jgi:phage antirepressor YoqD-like protein